MNYLSYVFGLILLVSAVFQPCDTHQNHPNQTRSALKTETIPITPTIISQKANFTKTIPTAEPTWDVDKKQQIAQTQTTLAIPAMTSEENTYLSITQPEWLRSNRAGDVAEIMEFGFNSSRLKYVEGNKGHYFTNSPYYQKLAAIASPEETVLPIQNFDRWRGEGAYAAQDMAIGLMPGIPDDILGPEKYHTSLCGVLAVSTLVNEDPAFFIWESYNHFSWAPKMYSHPGYGTHESNMIDMLEWKNWNVEDPVQAQSNDSCQNAPLQPGEKDSLGHETLCEWSKKMSSGSIPVIAANLMVDRTHGVLVSKAYGFSGDANAAHWVVVLQLVSSKDQQTYVRIYNPFMNREEIMLWDDLYMAWQVGPDLIKAVFYAKPENNR